MQKDFETWLAVMVKQLGGGGGGMANQTLNSTSAMNNNTSVGMNQTQNFGATDSKVTENLQAFYKARDAIYKDLK